ncbi:AI-2E family transporter [Methyloceanibacter sp.]|uniref:AI-2E family transporter n=1 Tax=Methyloceanibacter sp. TaxID=1965321 RepID=UPI002C8A90FA|nr:AI-2E family transporter [Methyloceanibacter sp.]HML92361.1 AI-2E family transporter [Methyloceanibacter sp.]
MQSGSDEMTDIDPPAGSGSTPGQSTAPSRHLINAFLIAGLVLFTVILLVRGSNVLIPLAVALLIWRFINALADVNQRLWSRWLGPMRGLALFLALLTIFAASLLALDVVVSNVSAIGASSREFQTSIDILLERASNLTGIERDRLVDETFGQLRLGQLLGAMVSAMTSLASQFSVVFVYVIFLLVEQKFFDMKLNAIVRDENRRAQIRSLLERVSRDVNSYVWIMTLVSLLTAALSYAVMIAVGVDHAAFWAFLVFILNFIPTVGTILATLLVSLYGLLQLGDFKSFLILLIAVGLIQFFVGNVLQPRMSAKTLNLSQFVVILSLFVWGALWGVVGMFLAVPITAILMIVLANFQSTRVVAAILSETGELRSAEDAANADTAVR